MTAVFMADPVSGKVGLFDEAPGGGDPADPTSLRNRPLLDPVTWLANAYFHSDLDTYEVLSDTTVTVNHLQTAAATTSAGGNSTLAAPAIKFGASSADNLLVSHGQGYAPLCIAIVGGQVLFPARPVQSLADGRGRYCTVYSTATEIRLYEWTSVANVALPAIAISYRILAFRQQRAPAGTDLVNFDPATGALTMARGRFDSRRQYAQVVPGGSPFGLGFGKTMDFRNGAIRFVNPDGTFFEPVPSTQKGRFEADYQPSKHYTGAYGNSMAYTGGFAGPEQILVQAP